MGTLDSLFGVHADALKLHAGRAEILASNLANADTPGYKARDIDFAAELNRIVSGNASAALAGTEQGHFGADAPEKQLNLQYRMPLQGSLDGNTVDKQGEVARFSQNALQYQASLNFINDKIRNTMTALKGE